MTGGAACSSSDRATGKVLLAMSATAGEVSDKASTVMPPLLETPVCIPHLMEL